LLRELTCNIPVVYYKHNSPLIALWKAVDKRPETVPILQPRFRAALLSDPYIDIIGVIEYQQLTTGPFLAQVLLYYSFHILLVVFLPRYSKLLYNLKIYLIKAF
jgi:hypothetical protein